ncbi:type VI secretion system-associated FHA domain protein TagH [Shewanella waksmanii]|uniref:type VI secretion system-associated FHA domain protein TagH n=1 Tax=Shewanella waksmanii TaxID=213783 RepID=UPI0037368028
MELALEIVSYHRLSPEQVSNKRLTESMTLGRSQNNDWHLPDPEKVVSGVHARIDKQHDGFYLSDLSTNGLFVNRAVEALGKERQHKLVDGDLLTFGDYEVKVSAIGADAASNETWNESSLAGGDSLPVSRSQPQVTGLAVASVLHNASQTPGRSVSSESDTSSLQPMQAPSVHPDLQDHIQLPKHAIPEAWEQSFESLSEPESIGGHQTDNHSPNHQTAAQPKQAVDLDSGDMKAFFDGLGVAKEQLPSVVSDALLFEMGQSMKMMLEGLMATLRQRSALKNQYRINQTTFQQQENNPLKFSASIDDVFQNLFLRRSSTFLSSKQAISAAFNDARKHDEAFIAGASGAMQGLLTQLDPLKVEQQLAHLSVVESLIPGQKQTKYWRFYKSLYEDMCSDFKQQGHGALSDDFIKAYDEKIKTI